jgi:hypothetical protein
MIDGSESSVMGNGHWTAKAQLIGKSFSQRPLLRDCM